MKGLFCANFAFDRNGWKACKSVWCGTCYTPPENVKFYKHEIVDEGGFHWVRIKDMNRHCSARDGDNLVTPFQCDTCVFRNLQGRNPSSHDQLLLECIRQANLDALWGRETATVSATLRSVTQTIKALQQVQVRPPYPPLGPFPTSDTMGYAVAIAMLLKSRERGRYAEYQQFESIRKLRAGYSNVYMASLKGVESLRTVGGDKAKHFLNDCPTHSQWFEKFSKGCLSRMGQVVKQDRAVSLDLMHALMERLECEWSSAEDIRSKKVIASIGAYALIAFCGSFRGPEVFLVDLFGLRKYVEENPRYKDKEYVIIPLMGRFKNELGEMYHLTPLAAKTRSGLEVKKWIGRLVQVRTMENRNHGPAFADSNNGVISYSVYEREILERFQSIQMERSDIIPADVQVLEEYGLSRSFRRGATSEARARGVTGEDVDLTNRWRSFEGARGHRPRLTMRDHYSDIRLMIPALLRFSESL
jgi:hypothetical protein